MSDLDYQGDAPYFEEFEYQVAEVAGTGRPVRGLQVGWFAVRRAQAEVFQFEHTDLRQAAADAAFCVDHWPTGVCVLFDVHSFALALRVADELNAACFADDPDLVVDTMERLKQQLGPDAMRWLLRVSRERAFSPCPRATRVALDGEAARG